MKKLFYAGLAGLALVEVMLVYFIMPMPGSQRMTSLDLAYALYTHRWLLRIACGLAIVCGARTAFDGTPKSRWLPGLFTLLTAAVVYLFNFQMAADKMFAPPRTLAFKDKAGSRLDEAAVVVGVEHNGEAKAYPIRYLVYHHQVQDTVGGLRVMVTYCSVCRTGRVFEPLVKGAPEKFRLVGMDHFNAMFEDATTGSWWRQATGEAVTGPLKGTALAEVAYQQMTLKQWFKLHPAALVMQADESVNGEDDYDLAGKYERGESKGKLTGTNHDSWQDKSWVIGVLSGRVAKAYDWNQLKARRIINDEIGGLPIVLVLASDDKSFAVFERHTDAEIFTLKDEVITSKERSYDLNGKSTGAPDLRLRPMQAYQEFWHSWRTFHPNTQKAK